MVSETGWKYLSNFKADIEITPTLTGIPVWFQKRILLRPKGKLRHHNNSWIIFNDFRNNKTFNLPSKHDYYNYSYWGLDLEKKMMIPLWLWFFRWMIKQVEKSPEPALNKGPEPYVPIIQSIILSNIVALWPCCTPHWFFRINL